MKKVFVTGANGLLGTNLITGLLDQGYAVTGLVRKISNYKGKQHPGLKLVTGDIMDSLSDYLPGCDYVIHAAAETGQRSSRYSDYMKANYQATVRLFNDAVKCGIKRFIYVSSANTLGFGSLADPGSEHKTIRAPFSRSPYALSKLESEKYLLQHNHEIDVVIVNPTFMIGAYDTKPGSGKMILMGWKKKIVFYPHGGKNFVHVADVAEGIIRCLDYGRNGEKYLLANKNLTYAEFFRKLNVITRQKPVMIAIPGIIMILLGYFGDMLRFFGMRTSVCSVNLRMLSVYNFYSNAKSVADLGMTYQDIDTAIKDAVSYFEEVTF